MADYSRGMHELNITHNDSGMLIRPIPRSDKGNCSSQSLSCQSTCDNFWICIPQIVEKSGFKDVSLYRYVNQNECFRLEENVQIPQLLSLY